MTCSKNTASKFILVACSSALTAVPFLATRASAQDAGTMMLEGIVIEGDSRGVEQSAEKIGTAVTVITGDEMRQRGNTYVSDALRSVPGVSVNRSGPLGALTQVRIRGAEANHTLVVIDGVDMSDPAQGEFDFSTPLTENVERIEVLRGAQSALWGSNATAGVINIITRKAEPGAHVGLKAEGGSFGTKSLSGYASAANTWARGVITASGMESNGFDASPFGNEDDGYENRSISFKGDADVLPNLNVQGFVRKTRKRGEYDDQPFAGPLTGRIVDADFSNEVDQLFASSRATLSTFDGHWKHSVFVNYTDYDTANFDGAAITSANVGTREHFGYQTTLQFDTPSFASAKHTIVGLVEEKTESFQNTGPFLDPSQLAEQERTLRGYVAEYRVELLDSLFLTGAYRFDQNDAFEDAETFRATAAYLLHSTETRFHGSYGKGVTNPTFSEQFGFMPATFIGNPNLLPEESISWDAGVEQSFLNKKLLVDVTYFRANLENEIATDFSVFPYTPINLSGESTRRGVEVTVTARPTPDLDIVATYTHLDSFQTGFTGKAREVRRPEHQASLNATYRFSERARTTVSAVYNGDALDNSFVPGIASPALLDGYTLLSVAGEYDLSDQITAFARVENALNENYEEVFGYNSADIAGYVGVRMRFGQ